MNKTLLVSLLFLTLIAPFTYAKTVTIAADPWYPMTGKPNSGDEGYMIDLAREVFTAAGYNVDYNLIPWERAVISTREGKIDCVVGALHADAPDFKFPKENWGLDVTAYFAPKDSTWSFSDVDSLLSQKVGVIEGYSYGEQLDELIASRKDVFKALSGNDALAKNLKKLSNGRLGVVIESAAVGQAKVKALGLEGKIKKAGQNASSDPIYIACSPAIANGQELVDVVDKGTKALKASGKFAEILAKYGLKE